MAKMKLSDLWYEFTFNQEYIEHVLWTVFRAETIIPPCIALSRSWRSVTYQKQMSDCSSSRKPPEGDIDCSRLISSHPESHIKTHQKQSQKMLSSIEINQKCRKYFNIVGEGESKRHE